MFHFLIFIIFAAFLWYFLLSKIIAVPRFVDVISILAMIFGIAAVLVIEPPSNLISGAVTIIFFASFAFVLIRKINKSLEE